MSLDTFAARKKSWRWFSPILGLIAEDKTARSDEPGEEDSRVSLAGRFPSRPNEGEPTMLKFMSCHTMPAGALKREQVNQLAEAARCDATVRPYRSFLSLCEGKVCCIMEAPSKQALAAWFQKMQMPCDFIVPVELEGECGVVKEA
jgi:hypothetical protein